MGFDPNSSHVSYQNGFGLAAEASHPRSSHLPMEKKQPIGRFVLQKFKIKHLTPAYRSPNIMDAAEWVGKATVAKATEVGHWLCR